MIIRKAEDKDLAALTEIYNYEVLHGVSTFDLTPRSMQVRRLWLRAHNKTVHHPLLVAEVDGAVAGYASLSPYRDKDAYAATVELSVYIAVDYRNHGLAKALVKQLIDMARECGKIHTIVSVITGGNAASVHLHEELGFSYCGTIHEVGMKFGQYLDIENYQLLM